MTKAKIYKTQNNENIMTKIAIFRKKEIRKIIHKNEWWFSIIDIIEALTGTERPRKYWNDLKKKIADEGYFQLSEKIGQLKILANDGKKYLTDCANTETMFRIIQSIPKVILMIGLKRECEALLSARN